MVTFCARTGVRVAGYEFCAPAQTRFLVPIRSLFDFDSIAFRFGIEHFSVLIRTLVKNDRGKYTKKFRAGRPSNEAEISPAFSRM